MPGIFVFGGHMADFPILCQDGESTGPFSPFVIHGNDIFKVFDTGKLGYQVTNPFKIICRRTKETDTEFDGFRNLGRVLLHLNLSQ